MSTLISEDLLLLLLDDDKGTMTGTWYPRPVLGGGLLIELALNEAATVEAKASIWTGAKVTAVPQARPEDDLLGAGYDLLAKKPTSAMDLVQRLGNGLQEQLADRLVERGILERRDDKVLGLFPRTRWPMVDSAHEDAVRRAITAALVQGTTPDERTAALIALLSAIDRAHKVVDHDRVPAKDIRKRAKEIADGDFAAKAVRDSISASMAAIATVAAGGAVAGSSS